GAPRGHRDHRTGSVLARLGARLGVRLRPAHRVPALRRPGHGRRHRTARGLLPPTGEGRVGPAESGRPRDAASRRHRPTTTSDGRTHPAPIGTLPPVSDTAEGQDQGLRAADGRMPGRRGLATRQKLLDCTAEMLRTTSYRDLKVVDIARKVGTSPATFYQYFPDVESAVPVVAEDMVSEGAHHFADIVADASWKSKASYDAALSLADEILAFWDEHRVVIRVVDLATEEGDRRFANVRVRLLNDLNNNIAAAV